MNEVPSFIWLKNWQGRWFEVATGGDLVRVVRTRRPRPPRLSFSWEYSEETARG
jgi:hypothetical protein